MNKANTKMEGGFQKSAALFYFTVCDCGPNELSTDLIRPKRSVNANERASSLVVERSEKTNRSRVCRVLAGSEFIQQTDSHETFWALLKKD